MATRQAIEKPIKSFEYSEVEKNFLYLGSHQTSKHLEGLRSLKITHIVNLAGKCHYPSDFIYGVFHIEDGQSTSKRDKNLPLIFEFIDRARAENSANRVLIHCRAGMSRTPFVAIAYLMHSRSMNLLDAFQLVRQCRSQMKIHQEHLQVLLEMDSSQSCSLEDLRKK